MTTTPLDTPTDFIPADDDRPAGEWMEGYWANIALWAKRFAILVLAYAAWQIYLETNYLNQYLRLVVGPNQAMIYTMIAYAFAKAMLTGLLGYRCFGFAQSLESALAGQNQVLLEKAFRHLHQIWIVALTLACMAMLSSISDWLYTINVMSEYDPGQFLQDEPPLQSED